MRGVFSYSTATFLLKKSLNYILDRRYKNPGRHELKISEIEINNIKKIIIEKRIYDLGDYLTFVE